MDELFEDLENEVEFNQDQILTQETTNSLRDYANAGLQGIDYNSYIVQTRMTISNLSVDTLLDALRIARDSFAVATEVSSKLLAFYVTAVFTWLNTTL